MIQSVSLSLVGDNDAGLQAPRRLLVPLTEFVSANRQRDALYLLSEQLHRANGIEEIYAAAMDAIEAALGCDRSAILLFDDAGVMQFVASRGLSIEYRLAVTGHTPWKIDEIDAVPIDIPDVASAQLAEPLKATVLGENIRAIAFVPLVSDGALIGKFMAYFREPYAFTKEDLAVALAIARQLAFSIQRNRTHRQLHDREAELAEELAATRLLQSLSVELAHEVDVEALYEKILDAVQSIMHSDFSSMQQYYPHLGARGELKLLGFRGFSPAAAKFWTWVRADSACTCGLALASRERVIAPDVEAMPSLTGSPDLASYRETGIRSVQSTPLLSRRGDLVGMISTHWKNVHAPSERDLRLLDILARLAADLIERKTQDEELRRREERLRTLTQLLTDVPWQARPDGAFAQLQPAWENYTGQTWDAHAGHGWFEAIHAEDRSDVQASWAAACFSPEPYECHARLWHAQSNQYRQVVIRATPIRNEDGSLREWVGACTEMHRAG
ncbi:MAG TPA: GAF domain-containing protein [Steroidobacteraceae bacterium]|nr:GAF domain-containing protein [Steroidobacteraceae bacterium]